MGLEGITNASFTSSIPWFNGLFNYRLLTKCNKHVWFYWTISERTACGNLVCELQCADIGLWESFSLMLAKIPVWKGTCILGFFVSIGTRPTPTLIFSSSSPRIVYCAWQDSCLSSPDLAKFPLDSSHSSNNKNVHPGLVYILCCENPNQGTSVDVEK